MSVFAAKADRANQIVGGADQPVSRHAWIGLSMLFVVALFNYIDRSIISILQVPLKTDLNLSDTQMGALTGLSFALLYTTMALPVARLADTVNRKRLIAAALAIWSAATACCGLANNFATLVAFRMGVAFGEAGCVPASHSMIADYFPLKQRGTALALWGLSSPLGIMLGFGAGGWLVTAMSWREAFLIFGIAGLVLAPFILLVREPKRGQFDQHVVADGETMESAVAAQEALDAKVPLRAALATLWNSKAFRYLALAGATHAFVQFTAHNWNAPFYVRVHQMPIGEVAFYLAVAFGLAGAVGQFAGGMLIDRLGRKDKRWYMWVPALSSLLLAPVSLAQDFAPSAQVSMAIGLVAAVLIQAYFAPIVATAQLLVLPRMRAFTSAMLVLIVNILGLGFGPLITGAISDLLTPTFGQEALRYAMSSTLFMAVIAGLLFARSAHHLRKELAAG
ncbi:MAG: transporter [Caulobacter sp.]|nr:transporter [Caulobacter sp.]